MKRPLILHVYPDRGGLMDYAHVMAKLYRRIKLVDYRAQAWADTVTAGEVVHAIESAGPTLVHFEIGNNQSSLYQASRRLLKSHPEIRQLVTLHDPQKIVAHPFGWNLPPGRTPGLILSKLSRRALEFVWGRAQVSRWSRQPQITFITLRKGGRSGAHYLPQPTYQSRRTSHRRTPHQTVRFGFLGYWSVTKGLSTLSQAWLAGDLLVPAELTIYGDSFLPGDYFAERFKRHLLQSGKIKLGGVPPDRAAMYRHLHDLDVLILPYWPENPAGASAVAMQAAEAGIPVVASRSPQLVEILGDMATFYDPPKSASQLRSALESVASHYTTAWQRAEHLQRRIYRERSESVIGARLAELIQSLLG